MADNSRGGGAPTNRDRKPGPPGGGAGRGGPAGGPGRGGPGGGGERRDDRGPRRQGKGGFGKGPAKPARVETYESLKELTRGEGFRIDKFVVAEKGTHRPVKVEYRLTREGLKGTPAFARLVDAQAASVAPLPEPEPEPEPVVVEETAEAEAEVAADAEAVSEAAPEGGGEAPIEVPADDPDAGKAAD
jgi:hypothetical protein